MEIEFYIFEKLKHMIMNEAKKNKIVMRILLLTSCPESVLIENIIWLKLNPMELIPPISSLRFLNLL